MVKNARKVNSKTETETARREQAQAAGVQCGENVPCRFVPHHAVIAPRPKR